MTTIKSNLRNGALSQYGAYPFTSFCTFKGRPLGAGPQGIFTLDGGDKDVYDEPQDISAWFELPMSQLGTDKVKQGRRLYISGEFNGGMTVTARTTDNDETDIVYAVTPRNTEYVQHTIQVPLSHKQKSEYWSFIVANVGGADFSIDSIDGTFLNVIRRFGL